MVLLYYSAGMKSPKWERKRPAPLQQHQQSYQIGHCSNHSPPELTVIVHVSTDGGVIRWSHQVEGGCSEAQTTVRFLSTGKQPSHPQVKTGSKRRLSVPQPPAPGPPEVENKLTEVRLGEFI